MDQCTKIRANGSQCANKADFTDDSCTFCAFRCGNPRYNGTLCYNEAEALGDLCSYCKQLAQAYQHQDQEDQDQDQEDDQDQDQDHGYNKNKKKSTKKIACGNGRHCVNFSKNGNKPDMVEYGYCFDCRVAHRKAVDAGYVL
jgi:hypothetical protein